MTPEEYYSYNAKNLERIYVGALLAPVFKFNERFPNCKIPFINYNDIMDYKFIIRVKNPSNLSNSMDCEKGEIVQEYSSMEELLRDGWILD